MVSHGTHGLITHKIITANAARTSKISWPDVLELKSKIVEIYKMSCCNCGGK